MGMKTIKERRRAPRSPSTVPLDICDAKGHAVVGEGHCIDMSVLGVRISSKKLLKPKSAVVLYLTPADKPVLELAGRVVWSRKTTNKFQYGVRFTGKPLRPLS